MTADDAFGVERERTTAGLVFRVEHFRTADTRHVCCEVTTAQLPGESDVETLRRAAAAIEAQHR